jgi:alpha-N-arabinofuranosidase
VNVLQSLILTRGRQILLTPTYHVFDLYKVHQDAQLVPIQFESPALTSGTDRIPALNVSASRDSLGAIHISLVNLDPSKNISIRTSLAGTWNSVTGQILSSKNLTDVNSFEQPSTIRPAVFSGARKEGNSLVVDLPAKSIVVLEIK